MSLERFYERPSSSLVFRGEASYVSGRQMEDWKLIVTQSDAAEDKHAFLVMAHKDDETLRGLLRMLDDERNDIFIHMDAKNTGWVESRTLASVGKAGIVSVPRISVTWGLLADRLRAQPAYRRHCQGHYSYWKAAFRSWFIVGDGRNELQNSGSSNIHCWSSSCASRRSCDVQRLSEAAPSC